MMHSASNLDNVSFPPRYPGGRAEVEQACHESNLFVWFDMLSGCPIRV